MYLLDLDLSNINMSNIKSEALAQECYKRKVFLRILQNSLCAGGSFTMKVQAAWMNQTFRFTFCPAQVFSRKTCENFRNIFENTNNSLDNLRSCKGYLSIVDFVIISYHSHLIIFVEKVGDEFL